MKNTILEEVPALSHELGREDRGFAILGERNTSARQGEDSNYVELSGACLVTLQERDTVECRFSKVLPIGKDETGGMSAQRPQNVAVGPGCRILFYRGLGLERLTSKWFPRRQIPMEPRFYA